MPATAPTQAQPATPAPATAPPAPVPQAAPQPAPSPAPIPIAISQPSPAFPQSPVQIASNVSPVKAAPQPTTIRMSSPVGQAPGSIALPAGVRPAPASGSGTVSTATLPSGQQIKVVGAGGQTHIIKSQTGGMSGIAALAAAAAQQGKMTTVSGGQIQQLRQQQIKVVQGVGGQQIVQQGLKMVTTQAAGATTAMIGG